MAVAAWHVPLPSSLTETTYGTALSVKVVVVLAALLFAAINRFVLYRRLRAAERRTDRRTLRTPLSILPLGGARSPTAAFVRSVRIELLLVVGVLLLSGFLTSVPTAADAGTTAYRTRRRTRLLNRRRTGRRFRSGRFPARSGRTSSTFG